MPAFIISSRPRRTGRASIGFVSPVLHAARTISRPYEYGHTPQIASSGEFGSHIRLIRAGVRSAEKTFGTFPFGTL